MHKFCPMQKCPFLCTKCVLCKNIDDEKRYSQYNTCSLVKILVIQKDILCKLSFSIQNCDVFIQKNNFIQKYCSLNENTLNIDVPMKH